LIDFIFNLEERVDVGTIAGKTFEESCSGSVTGREIKNPDILRRRSFRGKLSKARSAASEKRS
jgi:hypothetical protein